MSGNESETIEPVVTTNFANQTAIPVVEDELSIVEKFWVDYWVEVCVILGIIWLICAAIAYIVYRKFKELERKRKLQMNKGDTKAQAMKMHQQVE